MLHAEAAYIHDLRSQMEEQERRELGLGERIITLSGRGNLYPTHGLGPVAQYMNLAKGRGSALIVWFHYSSPARGRKAYAEKNYAADHKWNALDFSDGDLNTSIVKTTLGRTVMITVG